MSKDISESAKAVQEVARTAGKAVDAGKQFGGFIAKYVSGTIDQGMGIVEDSLRVYRWENQQRLMVRVQQISAELGLPGPTRPIPLKLAIRFFQGAVLEDEEQLRELWVKLLINSSNAESGVELKRTYIDILERLTSLEARILEKIYSVSFEEAQHRGILTANLPHSVEISSEKEGEKHLPPSRDVQLALANLDRLGCISFRTSWGGGEIVGMVNPTILGQAFVAACATTKRGI